MPRAEPAQEFPETTSITMIAPGELRSLPLRRGYDYWRALCGTRRFPSRDDIKPREVKFALTNMLLVKVIDDGADFQFRIIGDHAWRGYNTALTNRLLSDVAQEIPRPVANWLKIYRQVVESGAPVAEHVIAGRDAVEANFTEAEAVFLPLGSEDHKVDHILAFVNHNLKA